MAKIKDRLLLGAIAGLGGNIIKIGMMQIAKRLKIAEFDGAETAAGILLPAHKLAEPRGKIVGYMGDAIVAGTLGVATTYILSLTGKDNAPLKGALSGMFMWTALYGATGSMGISKVRPASPKTVLSQFIAHSAYGAVAAALTTQFGDPGLFTGKIPLSASSQSHPTANQPQTQQKENPVQMSEAPISQNQEQIQVLYH